MKLSMRMKLLILLAAEFAFLVSGIISSGSETQTLMSFSENDVVSLQPQMVNLTLIQGADSKGAGLYLSLFLFLRTISIIYPLSYFIEMPHFEANSFLVSHFKNGNTTLGSLVGPSNFFSSLPYYFVGTALLFSSNLWEWLLSIVAEFEQTPLVYLSF